MVSTEIFITQCNNHAILLAKSADLIQSDAAISITKKADSMIINIHVNHQLYRTHDFGPAVTAYRLSHVISQVRAEYRAGLISVDIAPTDTY